MKKYILLSLLFNLLILHIASAQDFHAVEYTPLSKEDCIFYKDMLGLKYCPHDNDHLAGAALACGHINNLPSSAELVDLARKIYNSKNKQVIYGLRDDKLMKELNIWVNNRRIFYWMNDEEKKTGYVRMFDLKLSRGYLARRDASSYISYIKNKKNKFKFPSHISLEAQNNSEFLSEYDALVAICSNKMFVSDDKDEINFQGHSNRQFCSALCGPNAKYRKTKRHRDDSVRICVQAISQDSEQTCSERSGTYKNIKYICKCPG